MEERFRGIEARLDSVERKVERNHQHVLTVMATQREIIQKAFSDVNVALLTQEVAFNSQFTALREGLSEVKASVIELGQATVDAVAELDDRVTRLEQGRPPAA